MLSSLHKTATGFFMKVLLGAIVLSFALWGIGDVFRSGAANGIVKVGDGYVSAVEFQEALNREMNTYRNMLGKDFNPELLKAMNVPQQVLERLVQQHLVRQEAKALGLVTPEDYLAEKIRDNHNFVGKDGKFDRALFSQVLAANNFTEKRYLDLMSREILADMLLQGVFSGISVPEQAAELAYRYQHEERVADILILPESLVKNVGEPDEKQIEANYKENEARFSAPETRDFSMVALDAAALGKSFVIKDEDLLIEYQKRIETYREPEKREVKQVLFDAKEAAQKAYDALKTGKSIEEVGKEFSATNADNVLLGTVTASGIIPEAEKTVFSLEKGAFSTPVQSSFGWHVFQVTDIIAPHTRPLAEVKQELKEALRAERVSEEIYNLSTALQDDLAGGVNIGEAAKKVGASVQNFNGVTADGMDKDGKKLALPEGYDELLTTAFALNEGETSSILETKDGSYYAVYLAAVQPAATRPLAEVRQTVVENWKQAERNKRLLELATGIAGNLAEQDASQVAATTGATLLKQESLTRIRPVLDDGTPLPAAMLNAVFSLNKPGQATAAYPVENGYAVAKLVAITPATTEKADAQKGINDAKENLRGVYADEMFKAYMAHLREKHGVSGVNKTLFDSLTQ